MKKRLATITLHNLGISSDLKGYRLIKKAVLIKKSEYKTMSELYCVITEECKTNIATCESLIRYAIDFGLTRANYEFVEKVFGYSIDDNKGKPSNSEFIFTVAEYLSEELESSNSL